MLQKKIDGYMKREFSGEKIILDLISRLNQNKETSGLWGWWKNTEPAVWIALYVAEALLQAEKMGYKVTINKPILVDYLIYNLESYNGTEKLSALNLLWLLGAKADFRKYMDMLEMKSSSMSMHEKLRLAELKQKTGHSVSLDTLLRKQNHTAFGNIYWGEDSYRFFDNAVQNTLVMYRLLRTETGYEDLLLRIRNYFLEKRNTGHWRNTYESALILETILPDLLVNDSLPGVPLFHISNQAITKFPYTSEIKGPQNVLIKKNGVLPVYFTAYQQRWNALPQRVAGNFEVRSFYEHNGEVKTKLKAGEPVLLRVNVSVLADAEYVMIEVPVPAGCSYKDKAQSYRNNEVHREYFKHKVSIFCSFLRKGDYTFTVSLLPRFTGNFTLNPAKAEMMYFPVYYGREALKKIEIL